MSGSHTAQGKQTDRANMRTRTFQERHRNVFTIHYYQQNGSVAETEQTYMLTGALEPRVPHLGVASLHMAKCHLGVYGVAAGDAKDLKVRVVAVSLVHLWDSKADQLTWTTWLL